IGRRDLSHQHPTASVDVQVARTTGNGDVTPARCGRSAFSTRAKLGRREESVERPKVRGDLVDSQPGIGGRDRRWETPLRTRRTAVVMSLVSISNRMSSTFVKPVLKVVSSESRADKSLCHSKSKTSDGERTACGRRNLSSTRSSSG